ncbi:MAG: EamA family transporter [Bacteroidetes bacterium]|nr:EamA family transporter [Bacteroidota bacterium]
MRRFLSVKWLMLFSLALIWGSSFILMKRGLTAFRPDQVASIRMLVACLASLPLAFSRLRHIKWESAKYMAVVGIVGSGIPAFLFATAQTRISSYLAGMLNALTPVFTLILGSLFFHSKFTRRQIAGVMIGFIGATGLVFVRSGGGLSADAGFAFLIVIATCCYGISVNTIKTFLSGQDTLLISSVSLLAVGIPYGIYLFTTDFVERLFTFPEAGVAFASLATLSIFGTALSNILYFQLVKTAGPLFASAVTYLMPVIALAWGMADGETLHPIHLFAMMAILAGVGLISWKGRVKRNVSV